MIETRKAKLLANTRKTGSGGTTFRATLPTSWIRQMGLSEDYRDLKLVFNGKEITIKNNKEEVDKAGNYTGCYYKDKEGLKTGGIDMLKD